MRSLSIIIIEYTYIAGWIAASAVYIISVSHYKIYNSIESR